MTDSPAADLLVQSMTRALLDDREAAIEGIFKSADLVLPYACWTPDVATLPHATLRAFAESMPLFARGGMAAVLDALQAPSHAEIAANSLVVRLLDDGDMEYVHYGEALASAGGYSWAGQRLSSMATRTHFARYYQAGYLAAGKRRKTLYTENAGGAGFAVRTWCRFVVPIGAPRGPIEGFAVGNIGLPGPPMWRAVSPRGASPEIVARCNDRHRRFALETAAALTRAADRSAVQMLDGGPIPFGLLAVDASRLRYANAGFLDAFGLDAQGLAAFEPASMFADTAVWKKVAETIVAGGTPDQIETDIMLARGRKAHMRLTFARGSYNGGAGIAIWLIDLSQRRALELELVAAREAAEEAARAKAGFLAAMSHDLRTPLNAIIGFGELIARIASDPAKGPTHLAKIADYATSVTHSGELLRTLVENVLEAARLESGKLELAHERLNVADTLGLALETLAIAASQKGVSLAADLAPDVEIEADARALSQIALNLIGNAIKYTDAGGAVRVRLTRDDDGAAVLEIADNGRGIGAADLARVIKPFERGEREAGTPRDGVGLGLAIAKGLVEAQNGTLDIASAPGKGTTIVVRLP